MTKTNQELESEREAALQSLPQFADELPEPLKPLLQLAPIEGTRATYTSKVPKPKRALI